MVEAAGQRWPDGWVKGEGFVRPPDVADPITPPPSFDQIGEEYVRQIVDLSPGQRKRYLGELQVLARTPVRGSLVFAGPVTAIGEAQLKTWLIEWDPVVEDEGERLTTSCSPAAPVSRCTTATSTPTYGRKLMAAMAAEGLAPFRVHDLRHTHVAWLVAGGNYFVRRLERGMDWPCSPPRVSTLTTRTTLSANRLASNLATRIL
jgi:hypothetical protein